MDAKSKTVRFIDTIYRTGAEKFWVRMD
jgi:hypothetical protein